MRVSDELVKEAFDELKGLEPLYEQDVDRALRAVLPKVRERLLDSGLDAAWEAFERDNSAAAALEAAFDHAFPEEES